MHIIKHLIVVIFYRIKNYIIYCLRSKKYTFIKDPNSVFDVLYQIKGETWETSYSPEIYGLTKQKEIIVKYPSQYIYGVKKGIVTTDSDLVLTEDGAWWDKYNSFSFMSCAIPGDANVHKFDNDSVTVIHKKRIENIPGKTLSLIGVYSYIWSHFLFQFVCKMYFAGEAGLLDEDLTILVDDTHDANIEQLLDDFLKKYPKVKKQYARVDTDYYCDYLLCAPSMSFNYNEFKFEMAYLYSKSSHMTNMVYKYAVNPYVNKIKNNPIKYKKIFLARHSNRILNNTEEVERYFKEQGFYFVQGAELSLEEKADLFYHAEIVAGLHGSAWQNIIFCKNVRCLMLTNYRYANEQVFYTMAKENVKAWLNVTGQDDNAERRTNFTIPLARVKDAYQQLLSK